MLNREESSLWHEEKWLNSRMVGSILLIASCCLGAGMLALPMTTGIAGFLPSLFVFVLIWLYMLTTAKLLLEANSWFPNETINLITLAARLLGPWGKIVTWITFLFLFYCLLTAFLVKGGELIETSLLPYFPWISQNMSLIMLTLGAFILVAKGIYHIDRINSFFLVAFFFSFFAILFLTTGHIHPQYLHYQSWPKVFFLLPFLITSFGFHNIIPSLRQYLSNEQKLRFVINVGGSIPLLVYTIWIAVMLSVIPLEGELSILDGFSNNRLATEILGAMIGSEAFTAFVWLFALTTIVTSVFGVGLSMVDFFIDGFKLTHDHKRLMGSLITFIPPFIFSQFHSKLFFSALEFAGGFAAIILYGFLPALIVWRGRYHYKFQSSNPVIKTKGGLLLLMAIALFVFILELLKNLNLIRVY